MNITKVQSVILDFSNGSPISGEVKVSIGPLKVVESAGFYLTDLTDERFKFGRDLVLDQQRLLNEANGFNNIIVRVVRRESF